MTIIKFNYITVQFKNSMTTCICHAVHAYVRQAHSAEEVEEVALALIAIHIMKMMMGTTVLTRETTVQPRDSPLYCWAVFMSPLDALEEACAEITIIIIITSEKMSIVESGRSLQFADCM